MEAERVELCESVVKRDRRGRRFAKAEERARWLDEYDSSGMTQAEFCDRHGLNVHTFVNWLSRRRHGMDRTDGEPPVGRFQELVLSGEGTMSGIEVSLPDGTRLRSGNARLIVEVLKQLRG